MPLTHRSRTRTSKKTAAVHGVLPESKAKVTPKVTLKVAPKGLIRTTLASTEMMQTEIGGEFPKLKNGATVNARAGGGEGGSWRGTITIKHLPQMPGDSVGSQQRITLR